MAVSAEKSVRRYVMTNSDNAGCTKSMHGFGIFRAKKNPRLTAADGGFKSDRRSGCGLCLGYLFLYFQRTGRQLRVFGLRQVGIQTTAMIDTAQGCR